MTTDTGPQDVLTSADGQEPAATPHLLRARRPARLAARLAGQRRRAAVGWGVLVVLFSCYVLVRGLPTSVDTVLIWLAAAMFVSSLDDLRRWRRSMIRDWLPLYAVLVLYALLRGYASHAIWGPFVRPQVDLDKIIGLGQVPTVTLQRWLLTPSHLHVWDYAAWAVYMSHFFTCLAVAAALWKRNYPVFRRFVPLYLGVTLTTYLGYVFYPADPPWLASQGGSIGPVVRIVPLVWNDIGVRSAAALFTGGSEYANNIAAMPSLHAAYPMLLALFFWNRTRHRWVRVLLVAYVLAMAFTLVYAGEHFVTDELAGWLVSIGVYFGGSRLLDRWHARRPRAATAAQEQDAPGQEAEPATSA